MPTFDCSKRNARSFDVSGTCWSSSFFLLSCFLSGWQHLGCFHFLIYPSLLTFVILDLSLLSCQCTSFFLINIYFLLHTKKKIFNWRFRKASQAWLYKDWKSFIQFKSQQKSYIYRIKLRLIWIVKSEVITNFMD